MSRSCFCVIFPTLTLFGSLEPEPGFFWVAGQGGYGIMMSSSLGRTAASLITKGDLPADIAAAGVTTAAIGPQRMRRA